MIDRIITVVIKFEKFWQFCPKMIFEMDRKKAKIK